MVSVKFVELITSHLQTTKLGLYDLVYKSKKLIAN